MRFSDEEIALLDAVAAVMFARHKIPLSRSSTVRMLLLKIVPSLEPGELNRVHRDAYKAVEMQS